MHFRIMVFTLGLLVSQVAAAQHDTLSIRSNQSNSKDAWTWSMANATTVNFGEANALNGGFHDVIRAETWRWSPHVVDTIRSFLSIEIPTSITANQLDSAYLILHGYSNPGFQEAQGDMRLVLEPVVEPWNESNINWENQPTVDNSVAAYYSQQTAGNQNVEINITELVLYSLQNTTYGWRLRLQNETDDSNVFSFASSENSIENLRPELKIVTKEPNSVENDGLPKETQIRLYPVPTDKVITLENLPEDVTHLQLHDLMGREYPVQLQANKTIDVSQLESGIYFLSVYAHTRFTLSFTVQK